MKVQASDEMRWRLLGSLAEANIRPRGGIHVSDLTLCLREAFFKRTTPKPPSEVELMFYTDGAARQHMALQTLSGLRSEVKFEKHGIRGTLDLLNTNEPVELNSTRSRFEIPPHWFTQLGYYCVFFNSLRGHLVILRLTRFDQPWEWLIVDWTRKEVLEMEREMKARAEALTISLETEDGSFLPHAFEKWKCQHCIYRDLCEAMP